MIRNDLQSDSSFAGIFIAGDAYVNAQYRPSRGRRTDFEYTSNDDEKEVWLRLVKEGGAVSCFYKGDLNAAWVELVTEEIEFVNDGFYVGIAVTSGIFGETATLVTSDFEISGGEFHTLDVGDVGREGFGVEVSPGVWNVKGAGSGMGVSVLLVYSDFQLIVLLDV